MPHHAQAGLLPERQDQNVALLTGKDLDTVRAALAAAAPSWSAELSWSSPEDTAIVVMPAGANDRIGPSFVLHRTHGQVHLDQMHWDEYRKVAVFAGLDAAIAAMQERLAPLSVPLFAAMH